MSDYYAILGVSQTASPRDIKTVFRKLAQQYHPDKNPNNPEAAQRFIQAAEAYKVLGDPDKRRMYDSYRGSGNDFSNSDLSNKFRGRNATEKASSQDPVLYKGLYWEPQAYREPGQRDEKLSSAVQSHQRIINAGYERHPYANEVFSLFCDGLEGKLRGPIHDVYEDMNANHGEWFADRIEVIEGAIKCYWGTEIKEFPLEDKMNSGHFVSIRDLPDDFVAYWWSKPSQKLPREIRVEAFFDFPSEGNILSVGRGNFYWFDISNRVNGRASRGVRSAK